MILEHGRLWSSKPLRQLGVLDRESLDAVARFARFPIKNRRGEIVGEVRPAFALQRPV